MIEGDLSKSSSEVHEPIAHEVAPPAGRIRKEEHSPAYPLQSQWRACDMTPLPASSQPRTAQNDPDRDEDDRYPEQRITRRGPEDRQKTRRRKGPAATTQL